METQKEIISKLQEIKPLLQKKYAVKTIGLFDSFADNTNTSDSDVDTLVEFEMKQNRTYTMYIEDMLSSIDRFEIIGGATKNIPLEIKVQYPNVPWNEMNLLRNRISHAYFGIDYEIIWDIIVNYLPENKKSLASIKI
jgi:uncharacterized protein with HEPN domain